MPVRLIVRSFDFSKWRFYEAKLHVPEITERAKAALEKHHQVLSKCHYMLHVNLGANGEVELWFAGESIDSPTRYFIEFMASGQARYVHGDPNLYKEETTKARQAGLIPLEPTPSDDAIK